MSNQFTQILSGITITLLCLFVIIFKSEAVQAQEYDQFLDYKRWGFHVNNVLYRPAYAKKIEGVYDIDPVPMRGINFGFNYTYHRERKISYYTGLDIDLLPFYHYYFEIPPKEFPEGTPVIGYDYRWWLYGHSVLTVPIGISIKTPIKNSEKFFYNFNADVRFHIISPGGFGSTGGRGGVEYRKIYGDSRDINVLTPTINLSGGLSYLTKYAIVNLNLNLQKGTIPYFVGGYEFYNLLESPDTKGIYKVRADYIGIDICITPKKFSK